MCWGTSIPQIFSLSRKKINRTLTIMKQSFLGETLGFRDCGKHLLEKHNVSNCGNPVPALAGTAENSPPLSGGAGSIRKYKIPPRATQNCSPSTPLRVFVRPPQQFLCNQQRLS